MGFAKRGWRCAEGLRTLALRFGGSRFRNNSGHHSNDAHSHNAIGAHDKEATAGHQSPPTRSSAAPAPALPIVHTVALLLAAFFHPTVAQATTFVWNGGVTTGLNRGNWSLAGNWVGGVAPNSNIAGSFATDDLQFASASLNGADPNANTPFTLNSITFNSNAKAWNITGNQLTFAGATSSITQSSASAQSINNNLLLNFDTSLAGNGSGAVTLSGAISGGANLTKTGSSLFVLTSAASNYTGSTTITQGVLNVRDASAFGTSDSGTSVATGAALQLQGDLTVTAEALTLSGSGISNDGALRSISGTTTWSAPILLAGPARISADAGSLHLTGGITSLTGAQNLTIGGAGNITIDTAPLATGSAALTKDGPGTLTVSLPSTYTGATTLSGGILSTNTLASGSAPSGIGQSSSAAANLVFDGGTLAYTGPAISIDRNYTLTQNGGAIDASGTGGLTLSGNLTASATTASQTLLLTGSNPASLLSGTINNGSDMNVTALTKSGTGTWTVSGASTYTGPTSITAGTLKLGAAGNATNTPLGTTAAGTTVSAGAALDLNGFSLAAAEALNLNGTGVSSGGALTNSASTAATYSGLITLGSSSSIVAASGDIMISNPGTITGSTFGLTLSGTSSASSIASIIGIGGGTVTKSGSGTWILSGANTYTGPTNITAGILNIQNAKSLGTIANGTTVTSGAALQIQGTTAVAAEALALNGTGISNDGALRNVSGTNSWAGLITLGSAARINSDSGTLTLTGGITGTQALTIGGAGNIVVSTGAIATGARALTKDGGGTLTISSASTYSSGTTISGGTLLANSTDTSTGSVGTGAVMISSGGTLGGSGQVKGAITVNGAISAGDASTLGKLTTVGETWNAAGKYSVKLNTAQATSSVAGTGFDQLQMTGLTVSSSSGSKFVIAISSLAIGSGSPFDGASNFSWIVAKTTGTHINYPGGSGQTGFDASLFSLDTANFSGTNYVSSSNNTSSSGIFALSDGSNGVGDNIILSYTAAPEPAGLFLLGAPITLLLLERRRRDPGPGESGSSQQTWFTLLSGGKYDVSRQVEATPVAKPLLLDATAVQSAAA